ncbi:MAG: flippase-like domain-containing protein, partial [Clostridiales bacterium]|nr:flippase-like domain-containing protein [Clostridiales bacterium]
MRANNFFKKNWFGLVTITFSLLVLVGALFLSGEKDDFIAAVKNMDRIWILVAFVFILLYWLLDALTLNLLTRTMYKNYNFIESFKTGMIGLLYSALTPFSTGGQPMQIYEMNKTGIKTGDACSIITVKSIIYQGAMTLFGVCSSFITWRFFNGVINNLFLYVFFGTVTNVVFIGCILFICVKKNFTKSIIRGFIHVLSKIKLVKNPEKTIDNANGQVDIFYSSVRALKNERLAYLLGILVTLAQLAIFYAIPYCVYKGFHLNDAGLLYMIAANALIAMITAFVPIPG